MSLMDWGAVISTVVTGVVGLAGIGGTIASARISSRSASEDLKQSITSEDARAKRAEKRVIYANYLGAITSFKNETEKKPKIREIIDRAVEAEKAAWVSAQEVSLVGSSDIATEVLRIYGYVLRGDGDKFGEAFALLVESMRADLNN
jgi:uncharacterized membrane-anchored protein YjiN (DUF445 family)